MVDLKHQLLEIRENDYNFTDYDLDRLITSMVKHIGTTDFVLRDELIYTTFGQMIFMKDLLDPNQLRALLRICLDDEHLYLGLGEDEGDFVFTRSFSTLVIALVLDADSRYSFLSKEEFELTLAAVFNYVRKERDSRGYVKEKGWAHALAHAADTLDELAKHRYFTEDNAVDLLEIIKSKVFYDGAVYSAQEDERFAIPVLSVVKTDLLSDQQINSWIGSFSATLEEEKKVVSDPNRLNLYLNVRNLLSSLCFRLRFEKIGNHLQDELEKTLDEIREF